MRIRIPTPRADDGNDGDDDDYFYTVHRSLLKANTNLLACSSIKPRESHCTLPASTSPAAFEAVLEYLYTGHYTLPGDCEWDGDDDEEAAAASAKTASVVKAAMLGPIGVWAKPAAVHDDSASARNISSYQSDVFPELRNGYLGPAEAASGAEAPPPPPSPTFSTFSAFSTFSTFSTLSTFPEHEPVLSPKKKQKQQQQQQQQQLAGKRSTPASRLSAHLEVYTLARKYAVRGLADVALSDVKKEVAASPEILQELVRVVYGPAAAKKQCSTSAAAAAAAAAADMRSFVMGIVRDHWDQLRHEPAFAQLLKDGGDFVLVVFSNVRCL